MHLDINDKLVVKALRDELKARGNKRYSEARSTAAGLSDGEIATLISNGLETPAWVHSFVRDAEQTSKDVVLESALPRTLGRPATHAEFAIAGGMLRKLGWSVRQLRRNGKRPRLYSSPIQSGAT